MKLVNCSRQLSLELRPGEPCYLVLESPREFRTAVTELDASVKEDTEDWILSEGEEILEKSSTAEVIFSPWTIEPDGRKIQKALLKRVLQAIGQDENFRVQKILSELQLLLDEAGEEMGCSFDYEAEDISEIIKECNIHFSKEGDVLADLHQYFRVCAEFLKIKLFILIGMRNYFTNGEIETLSREAGYAGSSLLFLENFSDGTEKNIILIDRDLCRVV